MNGLLLVLLLTSPAWALSFGTGCLGENGQEVLVRGCPITCFIHVKNDEAADEPVLVKDAHYVVHHQDGDEIVEAANTPLRLLAGDERLFPAEITADASDGDMLTMTAIGALDFEYPSGTVPTEESFPDQVTIVDTGACPVTTTVTEPPPATTTTTEPPVAGRPECAHASGHGVGLERKCR